PRAKLGRADETDITGRAAKCAATGAFAAKVDDAPSARETPHPQGCAESDRPKTLSSGQRGSRVGKFELGARLETMTKARHAHQEVKAERSIALLHRCGCTGANRRTCLIWPATELSVSAVPARAWVFLRQRRSRRELSLSNTKAASLRPSRPINLRPEA